MQHALALVTAQGTALPTTSATPPCRRSAADAATAANVTISPRPRDLLLTVMLSDCACLHVPTMCVCVCARALRHPLCRGRLPGRTVDQPAAIHSTNNPSPTALSAA
jgi:hypothetical protein